ncbi:MAG: cell division protein FtsZ [Flavobacteriales bacterium]
MKFDLPKENSNIIKVLGVGGGGSNAVNHMFRQGINGVDFLVCNTDQQALDVSPVPLKVQLGATLTEGRGAGSIAEVGKNAAMETIDDIKDIISSNTKMVFITAGMGGGTGTGAAPVIAKTAREMGVLTVGIVTMPFFFEGKKRRLQAEQGIEDIRENVDTLLIINNEKLREMCGNLPIAQAFAMADDVLTTAAKGIAEIITRTGYINVDFEDVRTVMSDSGVAIMGSASATGEERAIKAVEKALASPLLNDNNIEGARYVLLNIAFGNQEVLMDEISDITDYIQDEAGASADVIWGYGHDESLGDALSVTIIATGFNQNPNTGVNAERNVQKRKLNLEEPTHEATQANVPTPEVKEDEPFLRKVEEEKQEESKPTFERPAESQRVFEFEVTRHNLESSNEEEAEEKEEETEEIEQPFLKKVEDAEVESSEEVTEDPDEEIVMKSNAPQPEETKQWEPYRRTETSENPKPVVSEQPSFKTTTPEPQARQESEDKPSREEQSKRATDRLSRLRDLSMKLRTPSGMSDLENEPAFKRKQINLDDIPHSGESSASRFTLSEEENEDGEKKTKLRPNNPFLHDNVD